MARKKEFDPDEALEAARERFHRHGFADSSMQDLLEDMQIGQGSFYATFGSKKDLFQRALDGYSEEAVGHMVQWLRKADEPLVGLETLLERIASMYAGDPEHRGCFLVNTVVERAPHDPELRKALRGHWERLERAMTKTLEVAQQRGDISSNGSPRDLARMFVAVIHGIAVRSKYDPRPEVLRGIAKASVAALR
jgi:TetR/AcrR family transcriptional repressor of nem operon